MLQFLTGKEKEGRRGENRFAYKNEGCSLIRGYRITRNKVLPTGKKDIIRMPVCSYDDVKQLNEFGIVLDEDTVVIEMAVSEDTRTVDEAQIESTFQMLKDRNIHCRIYSRVDPQTKVMDAGITIVFRNEHRVMKKWSRTCNTFCGIRNIRIKTGNQGVMLPAKYFSNQNSKNEEGFILYDNPDNNGCYDAIPEFMLPHGQDMGFVGWSAGEKRDIRIKEYIQKISSMGLNATQIMRAYDVMNTYFMCEKVSSDMDIFALCGSSIGNSSPDDEQVRANELRFYELDKNGNRTRLKFYEFARWLIDEYRIIGIGGNQSARPVLYYYDGKQGIYQPVGLQDKYNFIESKAIEMLPKASDKDTREIVSYIYKMVWGGKTFEQAPPEYIGVKNGIIHVVEDDGQYSIEMLPNSPDIILLNRIPVEYHPNAEMSGIVEKVLNDFSQGDANARLMLEEIPGYCLWRENFLRGSAFFLDGKKRNGKSTYQHMIRTLLGRENVASVKLEEICERTNFSTYEIVGKLACIGDDCGNSYIKDMSAFRTLALGEEMSVRGIYQAPVSFSNFATFIFSFNGVPKFQDKTGSALDRIYPVPLLRQFNPGDKDAIDAYHLRRMLSTQKAKEWFLKLAVDGLIRLLTNGTFTWYEAAEDFKRQMERDNNKVLEFYEDYKDHIEGKTKRNLYDTYKEWADRNRYDHPFGEKEFCRRLEDCSDFHLIPCFSADETRIKNYKWIRKDEPIAEGA